MTFARLFTSVRCQCRCEQPLLNRKKIWNSLGIAVTRRHNSTLISRVKEIPPNAYVMLVFPCISFYLGVWQIRRRKWKTGLIEELDRKRKMVGVEVPMDLSTLSTGRQYESFLLSGEYDHSREVFIGPRSRLDSGASGGGLISSGDTIGVHVVAPFKLSGSGEEVLINRGWVTRTQRNSGQIYRPNGEQKLTAVYRISEKGAGDGSYDKRLDLWSKRSVPAIARSLGTKEYFFDLSDNAADVRIPNNPIAGQTNVQLRNEHLSYIFTWFTLTALMLLIWCNRHLRGSRGGHNVLSVLNNKSRHN